MAPGAGQRRPRSAVKRTVDEGDECDTFFPGTVCFRWQGTALDVAQRARIERLIGAIAENPGVLGVGIDEDTGVIVEPNGLCHVLGAGAVYVADGQGVTHTNVSEKSRGHTLCLFDVALHVLNNGTGFDLSTRRPFKGEG